MRHVTVRYLLVLSAYWFGLTFLWTGLSIIILPAHLLNFVPDSQKNSYLGTLTFVGLLIALIVQPISGALSDGWTSRWGRRRPLIAIGTVADFLFLVLLGWAGGLGMLFAGYLGLQISSNVAHGSLQGLLPDRVPMSQRGLASGLQNVVVLLGLMTGALVIGRLFTSDETPPVAAILVLMLVLAVSALITIAGAHEEASSPRHAPTRSRADVWRETFHIDWRAHRGYWWLLGSRFFYLFAIEGIQAFAQYYVRDRMNVPNPAQVTGDLTAAIAVAVMAFALIAGWLCDRWGRRQTQIVAGVVGVVGAPLLLAARTPTELILYGIVLGTSVGMFVTANWALATELAPAEEAGKFLGLTNLATAGAGALSRLEGPLIDHFNNALPGEWLGYTLLACLSTVSILLSATLLIKVPGRRVQVA